MGADNTAADHANAASRNARNAAEENASATFRTTHCFACSLDRKAPSDFAHRCKERQGAACVGHGFIGDGRAFRFDQALGLLGIRREMEIGEKDLAFA